MCLVLILTSFLFLYSNAGATEKTTLNTTLFEKVPSFPHGGGALAKIPSEVTGKIEMAREDILRSQNKVTARDHVTILSFAEDLGAQYVILVFGKDGKLQAGVSNYEKYGQCYEWSIQKSVVKSTCSGSEGGESWKYDITYDFKKMIGKIDQKK